MAGFVYFISASVNFGRCDVSVSSWVFRCFCNLRIVSINIRHIIVGSGSTNQSFHYCFLKIYSVVYVTVYYHMTLQSFAVLFLSVDSTLLPELDIYLLQAILSKPVEQYFTNARNKAIISLGFTTSIATLRFLLH